MLNADPRISGILILGLSPASIDEVELYRIREPVKDIEAVTPVNSGHPGALPCPTMAERRYWMMLPASRSAI